MRQMEQFATARLVARDWTADDLDAAFSIYGRDEVMRWLGSQPRRPVASREQMQRALDRMVVRAEEQPAYDRWTLALRATGEVVGAVFLSPLPGDDGEVEIGWHLNPDHWGAGYATEAGRGVIALAFGLEHVGQDRVEPELARRRPRPVLDRVLAVVDPDNARSLAVCRRLGMTHRGRTTAYYGETLELFELTRTAVR
jgi:RimJ/RimL family protein N-acetyltransferase